MIKIKSYLYIVNQYNDKDYYPLHLREKCKGSLIINHKLMPMIKHNITDNIPVEGDRIILMYRVSKNNIDAAPNNTTKLYSLLCDFILGKEVFGPNSTLYLHPNLPLEFILNSQYYTHLNLCTHIRYFNQGKLLNDSELKSILGVTVFRNLDTTPQLIVKPNILVNKIYSFASYKTDIASVDNKVIKSIAKLKSSITNKYFIVHEKNNKFSNNKAQFHNIKEEKSSYAKTVLDRSITCANNNINYIPYRRKIVASVIDKKDNFTLLDFLFENEVRDMDAFFYYIGNDIFIEKLFPKDKYPRNRFIIQPILSNIYFESEKIRHLDSNTPLDFNDDSNNLKGSSSGRPDGAYIVFDKQKVKFDIFILELKKHYSEEGDLSAFEKLQKNIVTNKSEFNKIIDINKISDDLDISNDDYNDCLLENSAFNNDAYGIFEDSHTKQADLFFYRLNSKSLLFNLDANKRSIPLINSTRTVLDTLSTEQQILQKKNTLIKLASIITYLLLGEEVDGKYSNEHLYSNLYKKTKAQNIKAAIFTAIIDAFKQTITYVFIIDEISEKHAKEMFKVAEFHNANFILYQIKRYLIVNKNNNSSYIKTIFKNLTDK